MLIIPAITPADILKRQKQIESLTSKMIQDAAKKYINPDKFIRAVLKPEKVEEKPKNRFKIITAETLRRREIIANSNLHDQR